MTATVDEAAAGPAPGLRGRRGPTVEALLLPIAALVGFGWTIGGIADNTMLVHLRTGIDIVQTRSFPTTDPYSYTANGEPWVLQSWLAEVVYGALYSIGSTHSIILFNALLLGAIAFGMARWVRTGNTFLTVLFIFTTLMLCVGNWSIRPTTFGFAMFFALLVVQKRSMWWSALVGVLWISLHGSWPLGFVWLGAAAVGMVIDDRAIPRAATRRLAAFAGGVILAGVVNPIGWRVLTFPYVAVQKSVIFENIQEWKSPNFHSGPFLSSEGVLVAVVVLLFTGLALRPAWRLALPVIAFFVLSLYSQRNLPFLGIGLASVLGVAWQLHQLRHSSSGSTEMPGAVGKWGPIESLTSLVLVVVAVGLIGRGATTDPFDLSTYPTDGLAYAEAQGYFVDDRHLLAPDFVGCLRVFQHGDQAAVFLDDRYDMYPTTFSTDALAIRSAQPTTQSLLDRYGVQGVLWKRDEPLSAYLSVNRQWRQTWSNKEWLLWERAV